MKKSFVLFAIMLALFSITYAQKKPVRKTAGTTPKKTDPSTKSENKSTEGSGAMFFVTVEHNGEKTEIKYTQFESHDGNALFENGGPRRFLFTYGAGNSAKNNDNFFFNGMVPVAEKGTYMFGEKDTSFGFKTSLFPNVLAFLAKSGSYEIIAVPLAGGFVEGKFTAVCEEATPDGKVEIYNLSGSFKVPRF